MDPSLHARGVRPTAKASQTKEARDHIVDLAEKFQGLKRLKNYPSTEAFCFAVNAAYPAYQLERRSMDHQVQSSKMNQTYQEALGRFCGFAWRGDDAEKWRTGSTADFLRSIENPPPRQSDTLLMKAPDEPPLPCKVRGLATVQIFTGQIGRGTADVGFELSCGTVSMFGVRVTIRRGCVEFDCDHAELQRATRKGFDKPYVPEGYEVTFTWSGGSTFKPAWDLEAKGRSIGNLDMKPDFATIGGLSPGDDIKIVFGVWRPDIEEIEIETEKSEAGTQTLDIDDDISVLSQDGTPVKADDLPTVKKRILTRIASEALSHHGDFIILSSHRIGFLAQRGEKQNAE